MTSAVADCATVVVTGVSLAVGVDVVIESRVPPPSTVNGAGRGLAAAVGLEAALAEEAGRPTAAVD